jgi:hypothetical protein
LLGCDSVVGHAFNRLLFFAAGDYGEYQKEAHCRKSPAF